jgi:hypothetical protein
MKDLSLSLCPFRRLVVLLSFLLVLSITLSPSIETSLLVLLSGIVTSSSKAVVTVLSLTQDKAVDLHSVGRVP